MKKILFFIILINGFLFSQKIDSVDFMGINNTKLRDAKAQVKTKKGSLFNQENISSDIKSLLETGFYENVEVEFDSTTRRLVFKLQEKPLIKKIELRGNKKISSGKIKEEISLKEKEYFDDFKLSESKEKIIQLYDEKGYIDTLVDTEKILDTKNKIHVIFLISEGRKVVVNSISFVGNRKYSAKKIQSLMKTKRKGIYRDNILKEDIQKIYEFYKNNGFYDILISTPIDVSYNEDRTRVDLKFKIYEGQIYKVGSINFKGNTIYSDKDLSKLLLIKSKKTYNNEKVTQSMQYIADLYADKGYLKVFIEPQINKDQQKGNIDITFNIIEGEKVYVDRIYIDGLNTTKEEVIRREVLIKEGDVFSSSKLRRSLEKIYNLGFLDDVKVDLQPTNYPNLVDLVLTVVEGKPGMLSAGAGYSSVDQLVGSLQVSHLNLFGRAQKLSLMWEFGARRQNYEISWTEPWFLKKPMSFGISLYDLVRQREYGSETNAYKEQRQGLGLSLGPRLSEYLSLLFSYSFENVRIFESNLPDLVPEGKKITSSLTSQIVYDTRDNIFDASRGIKQSFSLQLAGFSILSGDVKFFKPIIRSSVFIPTFWKFVLSFNSTLGYIQGIDGYDLKNVLYEKFYAGGAETVRGYGYRTLGPDDGGTVTFIFNTEYKFPIVQENKRTILQGVITYDAGGCWNEIGDIKFAVGSSDKWRQGEWDNQLKHSAGFGIRFTTPVFPLRLDWSWALNPRPSDDILQFWFTIGQMF